VNNTSWKDIAELVGIAAIVGSLVFVGLQMKQSQDIALSAAYQARADTSIAVRIAPFESEILLSSLTKSFDGRSAELTPDEHTALQFYFWTEMIYLDNMHYQYINGFLTNEQWQSNVDDLKLLLSRDVPRATWEQGMTVRDSFKAVVENVIQEIDSGRSN
jgi:hypothetical protein